MIFRKTEGIVLRITDYSNTSKIVNIYTRDHGKLHLLAKGAKRKRSDFLGILEPLCRLEIVYIDSRSSLQTLKEAHLIDSYLELRNRLSGVARGLFFLSLVDRTQADEDPHPAVFQLLLQSLATLQRVPYGENVSIVFQLRLLEHFGRQPSLTACGRCGATLRGDASVDTHWGYLLCHSCEKESRHRLSRGTLQALRHLAETPLERCSRIVLSKGQRAEIIAVIGAMYRTAIEVELPSEKVVSALLS